MDCLPLELSAPEGQSLKMVAEKMQEAAVADDACNQALPSRPCVMESGPVPLSSEMAVEERIVVLVAPSGHKPEGRAGTRPRSVQRTPHQDGQLPLERSQTPRNQCTPRLPGAASGTPPSLPCPSTSKMVGAPAPPSGPAPKSPRGGFRRPHHAQSTTSAVVMDKPPLGALRKVGAFGSKSPRQPSESTRGSKSAMEMDMEGEVGTSAEAMPRAMVYSMLSNIMSKERAQPLDFAKSSMVLPQIVPSQPSWEGLDAACGDTWRNRDIM